MRITKPSRGMMATRAAIIAQRAKLYREARAIIAMAALEPWKPYAPNYWTIAKALGLPKKSADVADAIWNDVNGPDEGQRTEERALERVMDLLRMEGE